MLPATISREGGYPNRLRLPLIGVKASQAFVYYRSGTVAAVNFVFLLRMGIGGLTVRAAV